MQAIRRFAFRLIYPESGVAIASISISANSATVAFSKGIYALAKCRSKQLFWELEEFPVAASPSQREIQQRLVGSVFERSHYRQEPVNDPVSSLVLDRYVESLDGNRSYFLASDVAEFERYRYQLDDAVTQCRLGPAFEIFNRFQARNRERMAYALAVLKTEPDFTVQESFDFDREHAPWAATSAELDEIWRKRVKNDALSLMLADKTWPEARDILQKRYERAAKRSEQVTSDDVFENFMNSFASVFDPHSNYFSPRNSEEYRIQMSLSYEGIGASLQVVDDFVTIMEFLPGGSAQQSGELKATDRILAVGQDDRSAIEIQPGTVIGWRVAGTLVAVRLLRSRGLKSGQPGSVGYRLGPVAEGGLCLDCPLADESSAPVRHNDMYAGLAVACSKTAEHSSLAVFLKSFGDWTLIEKTEPAERDIRWQAGTTAMALQWSSADNRVIARSINGQPVTFRPLYESPSMRLAEGEMPTVAREP